MADYSDRTFFEIKPSGRFFEGLTQIFMYDFILNNAPGQQNNWNRGEAINYIPTPLIPLQTGEIAIVSPPVFGVILYDLINPKITLQILATAATSLLIAQLIAALITKLASPSGRLAGV